MKNKTQQKQVKTYPDITIHMEDDKTIVAEMKIDDKTVRKAVVKCHPEDKFDYGYGVQLVLKRLLNKEYKDESIPNFNHKRVNECHCGHYCNTFYDLEERIRQDMLLKQFIMYQMGIK